MTFIISTTASAGYRSVLDYCLPSWYKNSGASRIDIHLHDNRRGFGLTWQYLDNIITRCERMRDAVHDANGRKLLLMDCDCLVLRNLAEGFSNSRPISVAHWPEINMGVLFFNMELNWPFDEFIDEFVDKATRRCRMLMQVSPRKVKQHSTDQVIMIELLLARETAVHKLDGKIWNYRYSVRTTKTELDKYKAEMRVLHLRVRTTKPEFFPRLPL